jgi:allantoinase
MLDTRILGGTLVSPDGTADLDLGILDGRIAGVYERGAAPDARATIAADGLLVLPGIIDVHFHCRAPGFPEREDFDSGTQAAAAGGVTTVFEMPMAYPGVHTAAILNDRRALLERTAHVDVALWGGGGSTEQDIAEMAEAGAIGFKFFLHAVPAGREIEFAGLTAVDSPSVYRALQRVKATGLPAAIHCEDNDLIQTFTAELQAAGDVGPSAHERSRPGFVETVAVSKVLTLNEAVGARIHFPHISTARATELIADARRWGQAVTVETCPHYLLVEWATVERLGPYAKINPPIRPDAERIALWSALCDRRVDIVASDHAPYSAVDKEVGWVDIFKSTSGYPGVETMGPLLFDRALAGELSLSRAVELLSSRPAEVFGLAQKGSLQPGGDADLLLLDPNGSWTIEPDKLFTRSKASARLFAGSRLRGRIVATYLRGEAAFAEGRIANPPGTGRFVRP